MWSLEAFQVLAMSLEWFRRWVFQTRCEFENLQNMISNASLIQPSAACGAHSLIGDDINPIPIKQDFTRRGLTP